MLRSIWLRLSRRARLEQDLRDEIDFHLAMKAEQLGDAAAARRAFGNDTRVREDLRDAWGFRWFETLWHDVRYAARSIRKTPGFALIAVLSLAIGIGANTAIFTVLYGVFLQSLPLREPARLRILNWTGEQTPARSVSGYGLRQNGARIRGPFSWEAFQAISAQPGVFESFAGFAELEPNAVAGGVAQVVHTQLVSAGYFETLGLQAAAGRTLGAADNAPGAPHATVVSWRFAERTFGDPRRALGASIAIDRTPYTIAGVLPPSFTGLLRSYPTDIYVPIAKVEELSNYFRRSGADYWWVQMIGRLRPGATDAQARAQLDVVLARVADAASAALGQSFQPPKSVLRDGARGLAFLDERNYAFLLTVFAMVGVVLLIACANVANLLIARGAARARELAVRQSIGAGRLRIMRHLFTETALIAVAGALLGLLLAPVCSRPSSLSIPRPTSVSHPTPRSSASPSPSRSPQPSWPDFFPPGEPRPSNPLPAFASRAPEPAASVSPASWLLFRRRSPSCSSAEPDSSAAP